MSRQFIIHITADEFLAIDISGFGVTPRFRPTTRFSSWAEAEQYFRELGATEKELDTVWRSFEMIGKGILTIQAASDDYTPTEPAPET